jgi:hypothetical protein
MAKRGRRRGSRKQNQNQNMLGGAGAADHAIAVFGQSGAQHAAANTNVIAMNNPSLPLVAQSGGALVPLAPAQAGGALVALTPAHLGGSHPLTHAQLNGGNVLNDIAVPATFLLANSVFKKRRSSKRGSKRASKRAFGRRRRGSSRRR